MASLFDRIANRLARVQSATPPDEMAAPTPAPTVRPIEPVEPMTLESFEAALGKLSVARMEQLTIVDGAEAERDRIMDDPDGDDGELLAIDNRVALARLSIDRIARLEDEAMEQLQPLRQAKQRAEWGAARDQFVAYARKYQAAMEALERSANQLWAVRQAMFAPLNIRGWEEQVPRLPRLMIYTPDGSAPVDSAFFAQTIDQFSTVSIGGPPPAENLGHRLAAFIHGRVDATSIDRSASFGVSGSVNAVEVLVRLTRDTAVEEGEVLRRGAIVRVSAIHARDLVAADRATLTDPMPAPGVGGKTRVLPVRSNPVTE